MIDIQRRNAFAHAFVLYPEILTQMAGHTSLYLEGVGAYDPSRDIRFKLPLVYLAQFAVRLIQTRAQRSDSNALALFSQQMVKRYVEYRESIVGNEEIHCAAKHREALLVVEQGMADQIFGALKVEAECALEAMAKGEVDKANTDKRLVGKGKVSDFSEVDFWRDVFLSFIQNWKPGFPQWADPLQYIFLDHIKDFADALDERVCH